jgi:hypothetical protein
MQRESANLELIVDGRTATATLNDTDTAHDFVSLLPLTLQMHDLIGREKPGQLPRALVNGDGQ